jgi:hypothetical protein
MSNSNVGYCHTHHGWTVVDTGRSQFACGELAVWDVPRGRYISVQQLEAEMPRMPTEPTVWHEYVLGMAGRSTALGNAFSARARGAEDIPRA